MKYQDWLNDIFLRDITDVEDRNENLSKLRTKRLLKLLFEYANFRNIELKKDQFVVIAEHISSEVTNFPYLKFYTIKWALKEYTNPENHNISAAVIMSMIRKVYNSAEHQDFIKQWFESNSKNMIPEKTNAQKEEENKKARLESFERCKKQVISGSIDYNNFNWRNAVEYLAKDTDFKLQKHEIDNYHSEAEIIIREDLKKLMGNINTTREDRSEATRKYSAILDRSYQEFEPDLYQNIVLLRRKLVVRDYIINNN